MGMNFRETMALLREAESRDNLAKVLKGGKAAKEFRVLVASEREGLERAAGGKRKLEQADKVLAEAEAKYVEEVAKGQEEGFRYAREAADKIKAGTAALARRQETLDALQISLDERRDALGGKSKELEDAALAVKARETVITRRGEVLDDREAKLTAREGRATRRETEIKRFDDWRAAAPA